MKPFQIFNSMVDHLDLFFHHRHSPGEFIVLPDFSCQHIHLGFHDSLVSAVGDQNAKQRDGSGDNG